MQYNEVVVLCVMLAAVALFVAELVPLGVTGLCIMVALGLSGVLETHQAVSAIASPAVILVGSLYVVSASLIRTGVVSVFGGRLLEWGEKSETRLLIVSTSAAAFFSMVLNNTSVVVLMIPILLGAAQSRGIAPSRLLMPVSYASILGGTMTLIGTSTNILVADLAQRESPTMEPLGFFEFFPVGAGFAAVGLLYLWTIGRILLPSRPTVSSVTRGRAFEYVTEFRITAPGAGLDLTPQELSRRAGTDVRVLQIIHGEEVLDRFTDDRRLVAGDVVVLRGVAEAILALRGDLQLEALPSALPGEELPRRGTTFAEIVITPASDLIGSTITEIGLHRTFGVVAVALQRRGAHLRHGITDVPLRIGDTILIQGAPESVERLRTHPGLILLVGVEQKVTLRRRAPIAVGILGAFIVCAAFRVVDLQLLAIFAATLCILTGCISFRGAVEKVDWNILCLLAGSITLGLALHESGLAGRVAGTVVSTTQGMGPAMVLSAVYLLTAVTTEFVSNTGAAALLIPIAIATAERLHVDARPFVFAVAYGASASFSTPIGYQTNAFIYGPGGYRFRDFFRVGFPLQILLWVYACIVIPRFFPF